MKKRKSTINKKRTSAHTRRFRTLYAFDPEKGMKVAVGQSPPIRMRSMASVGGPTRRAMKKATRVGTMSMPSIAMLPAWLQGGIAAFAKVAAAVQAKAEEAKKRRQRT